MNPKHHPTLKIIDCPKIAMAYLGWGEPRVVVTTGAIQKLPRQQFWALVSHELGHAANRHYQQKLLFLVFAAVTLAALSWAGGILGAVVGCALIVVLYRHLVSGQELEADDFAARDCGAQNLLSALIKIGHEQPQLWRQRLFLARIKKLEAWQS